MAWSGPLPKWLGERGCLVPGRTTEASLEFAMDRRVSYRAYILQTSVKSQNHGRRNSSYEVFKNGRPVINIFFAISFIDYLIIQ